MYEFLQTCFDWPILPASVLLCIITAYWLMVIFGVFDFGSFDVDLDVDVDGDIDFDGNIGLEGNESILHWGMAGLKWFNLGDVPLMIWMTALALPAWLIAVTFDKNITDPTTWETITANLRNFGIALFAAKLFTQPLKGKLKFIEPNPARKLIGKQVTISNEATETTGHAHYHTGDGAPLQLNVRAAEGIIEKGTIAEIVEYDPTTHLFRVIAMKE